MTRSETTFVGILFLSLTGIFLLWKITSFWGIGLSPDSAGYISAARGLLKGIGLVQPPQGKSILPMFTYGPLFSILLAAIGFGGTDPVDGARILNAFLFGANIFLAGWITLYFTRSRWAALLSSFFMLTSLVTLEIHSMALSEPVFIFFGFLGLFLLTLFLEGERSHGLLLSSSIALGLAFLAKYSGVSFVMAGFLAVLLLRRRPLVQRVLESVILGALGCFPMLVWIIRNRLLVGKPTELSWNFEPYILGHIRQLFAYFSMWLLPEEVPAIAREIVLGIFLLSLLGASLILIRRRQIQRTLPGILLLISLTYIGTYLMTTVFMGEQPFDNRALSPVFVAGLIYVFFAGQRLWQTVESGWIRGILLSVLAFLAVSYTGRAIQWGKTVEKEGLGYAAKRWKNSDIIARIRQIPSATPIYTNGPDSLYLLTLKPALAIPAKEYVLKVHVPDPERRRRKEYEAEVEEMKKELRTANGLVVYLKGIYWRWYYPSEEELQKKIPLRVVETFSDGTIYKIGS